MSKTPRPRRLGKGLSHLMNTPVRVEVPPTSEPSGDEGSSGPKAEDSVAVNDSGSNPTPDAIPPVRETVSAPGAPAQSHRPEDVPNLPQRLSSTAADAVDEPSEEGLKSLPLDSLSPDPNQPRQRFDETALSELAESIRQDGLMQPILARPMPDGAGESLYQIVAGERRWRAAGRAGLAQVPVLVRSIDSEQTLALGLIENLQREDLNPIEKARAFRRLNQDHQLTHEQIADRVGLQRSSISNHLRLLDLHVNVLPLLEQGLLSMGVARPLLGLSDLELQPKLAERAVRESWSARQAEQAVRQANGLDTPTTKTKPAGRAVVEDLSRQLSQKLGTKVKVKRGRKAHTGTIELAFFSLDEFEGLLQRMDVTLE